MKGFVGDIPKTAWVIDYPLLERIRQDPEAPAVGMRSYARPVIEHNEFYNCGAGVGGLNFEDYTEVLQIRNNIQKAIDALVKLV